MLNYAYARVSSVPDKEGKSRQEASIEDQEALLRRNIQDYADHENLVAAEPKVFLERHSAAFCFADIRKRPVGKDLLQSLETARQQHPQEPINLFVARVDRWSRGWIDGSVLLRDLQERLRIRVHFLDLGGRAFDASTHFGQKQVADLMFAGEVWVRGMQAVVQKAHDRKREDGELCGTVPYGFQAKPTGFVNARTKAEILVLEEDPGEIAAVGLMLAWRTAGQYPGARASSPAGSAGFSPLPAGVATEDRSGVNAAPQAPVEGALPPELARWKDEAGQPPGWQHYILKLRRPFNAPGLSLNHIAKALNQRGVPAKEGGTWSNGKVGKVLASRSTWEWVKKQTDKLK